jgi:hypothetical protein
LRLLVAGHHGQKRCRPGQKAVCRVVPKQRLRRILQIKRLVEDERRLEVRRNLALILAGEKDLDGEEMTYLMPMTCEESQFDGWCRIKRRSTKRVTKVKVASV